MDAAAHAPAEAPTVPASEFVLARRVSYDQRSPARWAFSHIIRYPFTLLLILFGALGNAACAFALPLLIGVAFNNITGPKPDLAVIANCSLLIVLSQVIRAGLMGSRNFASEMMGQRIERDTRDELYANLLGKSMTFHSMYPVGDIMARATNDVHELNLMFPNGVNLVIGSGMFLVIPLFTAPSLHPQLIAVPLVFLIAYYVSIRLYASKLKPATEAVREAFGTMNTDLAESLEGIETVKSASQEPQELDHFYARATAFRDAFVRQSDIEARFIPLLLLGIAEAAGLLHSVLLYQAGQIQIGQVVAFMGGLQMFGFPVWISLTAFSQIALGLSAAQRILRLIAIQTDLDENRQGRQAAIAGDVSFEKVSFGYPTGGEILKNVSFRIRAGQTIAIVGQTGAGKSTLTRLINRTYDASEGSVRIDGYDVRDWSLESIRSQISIIEQDIFLFSRTIGENIAFGNPTATQAAIEQAAREAQAHDFIMSFKDGYATVVGERGVTLSGGQRQRIALARAFLADPRILILDDSTSAIDSATEDQIQRAILRASSGRTTFLITHRLSQIRWADWIIVLRKGQIAAQGRHEDLLQTSEPYRRIFATYEKPLKQPEPAPTAAVEN